MYNYAVFDIKTTYTITKFSSQVSSYSPKITFGTRQPPTGGCGCP